MKDNKLTLIMMAGLPAAGKSTLANALTRELKLPVVDKDKYRIELIDHFIKQNFSACSDHNILDTLSEQEKNQIFNNASDIAYRRSLREIRISLLERKKSVIFDSPALHQETMDNIHRIIDNHKEIRLRVILCIVDRGLRHRRMSKRDSEYTLYTREFHDPLTIDDYRQCFTHLPDDTYELFTDQPIEACVEEAKQFIQHENFQRMSTKINWNGYLSHLGAENLYSLVL